MLPFNYEGFATKDTFFGRKEELIDINTFAQKSNNLLIYSLRRFGKSSMIKEQIERDTDTQYIYFDIFDITSENDFARLFLKAIAKAQKGGISTIMSKLPKLFSRVSFDVVFDSTTGKTKLSPTLNNISFEDAIEDAFNALFLMSEKQKLVVAIDEFQQVSLIENVKIDALLRKYMQENKKISYFFLGSKRHMLTDLFRYKAPLYEMATHYELQGIKLDDYIEYIQKYLKISDAFIVHIIDVAKNETKLIVHICSILYDRHAKKNITEKIINEIIKEIVMSKHSSYSMLFDSFSLGKKKAFKILCNHKDLYKKEVLDEYSISKQSLLSSLNALFKDEIIDKDKNWFIPDRTLELWGKSK
ncbi:ATP-binding protein [Sulfurimonas sp.]|uniref:AAA family ATPase n=1 Tax=Sulfurimonas sp. TaxID=2022749 RepID=UPI0025DDC427|nr:ATP-binding protein [Sulfurimonas sp.]